MNRKLRRVLILFLILGGVWLSTLTFLGEQAQKILQPALKQVTAAATSGSRWWQSISQAASYQEENERLRHQVAELSARQATAEALQNENEELRQLVGLATPEGYEHVAVEVIGQQVDESGVSYLLDKGSQDGLEPGLAVAAGLPPQGSEPGLILVGVTKWVGQKVAGFNLITNGSTQVLAKLSASSTGQALATGEYNLAVRLKFIEVDQTVEVGDAVVTSNLNNLIPAGLLIGYVTAVDKPEGELFQSAVVVPPVSLEQFRFLYVLKPLAAR